MRDSLLRLAQRVLRCARYWRGVEMRNVQQLLLDVARRVGAQHVHWHTARFGIAQSLRLASVIVAYGQDDVRLVLIADELSRQAEAADLRLESRSVHPKRIDPNCLATVTVGRYGGLNRRAAIDRRCGTPFFEAELIGDATAARPSARDGAECRVIGVG